MRVYQVHLNPLDRDLDSTVDHGLRRRARPKVPARERASRGVPRVAERRCATAARRAAPSSTTTPWTAAIDARSRDAGGRGPPEDDARKLEEPEPARPSWPRARVGIIGGRHPSAARAGGLDLGLGGQRHPLLVDVASTRSGALIYMAGDAAPVVKQRLDGICRHRGRQAATLPIGPVEIDRAQRSARMCPKYGPSDAGRSPRRRWTTRSMRGCHGLLDVLDGAIAPELHRGSRPGRDPGAST